MSLDLYVLYAKLFLLGSLNCRVFISELYDGPLVGFNVSQFPLPTCEGSNGTTVTDAVDLF
jgi:hypothetical protein